MPKPTVKSADEIPAKRASGRIFIQEIHEGLDALDMTRSRLFISALSAGLDLSLSLFLIAVVRTIGAGSLSRPATELLDAMMYSFGFVIVILGRGELFTEQTTLSILPLLTGQTTLRQVGRLWGIVYLANFVGAAVGAGLIVQLGPALGVVEPKVFGQIAHEIVNHSAGTIVLSGLFAGWLMGLVSWLVAAGRDTISQIAIIWMGTAAIGLGHLHHAVLGTSEMLGGILTGSRTTWAEFGSTLLFTTIGNAIGGGGFVALLRYGHAAPDKARA